MTTNQIKSIIYEFAKSQGFYGRLARDLDENDAWDSLVELANQNNCTDTLDVIMMLES